MTAASRSLVDDALRETNASQDETVAYTLDNEVAVVELRRPAARNALNAEMRAGLWRAYRRFEQDADALVMLLCAQGRHFCAGGDLKEMSATALGRPPADFLPIPRQNIDVTKPIVAAVQGAAHGGGFLLAQTADLVIAAADATFGVTEARWGRGAPWAWPLPALIGTRAALQLLITAEPADADRARQMGFVNDVAEPDEVRAAALQAARRIAALAPLSVRGGLAMAYGVAGLTAGQAHALAEDAYRPAYDSDDAREGPAAFLAKRPPVWTGHLTRTPPPAGATNGDSA